MQTHGLTSALRSSGSFAANGAAGDVMDLSMRVLVSVCESVWVSRMGELVIERCVRRGCRDNEGVREWGGDCMTT